MHVNCIHAYSYVIIDSACRKWSNNIKYKPGNPTRFSLMNVQFDLYSAHVSCLSVSYQTIIWVHACAVCDVVKSFGWRQWWLYELIETPIEIRHKGRDKLVQHNNHYCPFLFWMMMCLSIPGFVVDCLYSERNFYSLSMGHQWSLPYAHTYSREVSVMLSQLRLLREFGLPIMV